MSRVIRLSSSVLAVLLAVSALQAQVYSPQLVKAGEPDTSDLKTLAAEIYENAHAVTPREKAEAIWRYYLTDGRFVKPGIFYHLAGWAYEEPSGQVLDPIKLLNSYGYGLCYQDGPLMAATYLAGGFKDARVWFLTGHTVAEVYYDGAYHYFDGDMLGYNPVGSGPLKQRDVASVYQIEHDGNIMLKNVTGPHSSNPRTVDYPWYPADVRAGDMDEIAGLFTSTKDNYLYAYRRYPQGHTMDFVLRPGESMVRYYRPTPDGQFYLPYTFDGKEWKVLPDFAQFHMVVEKGPKSEKDNRMWATGRIEYEPVGTGDARVERQGQSTTVTFTMPSPYVIIDAEFRAQVSLPDAASRLMAETSVDGGRTWTESAALAGPWSGSWTAHPARLPAKFGRRNAVSGTYSYLVRFSLTKAKAPATAMRHIAVSTVFQLNPRTLPALAPGVNQVRYHSESIARTELPVVVSRLSQYATQLHNVNYEGQNGQGYMVNVGNQPGDIIFKLQAGDGENLSGFDVGGRFLDLTDGIAPDKFTAEVRKVTPWPAHRSGPGAASIAWSATLNGPWKILWTYDPKLSWLDGQPIPQVLRWPEVDKHEENLPAGAHEVYIRYQIDGLAVDHFRMATIRRSKPSASQHLEVTQVWEENGIRKQFRKDIPDASKPLEYSISVPQGSTVQNIALIFKCPAKATDQQ